MSEITRSDHIEVVVVGTVGEDGRVIVVFVVRQNHGATLTGRVFLCLGFATLDSLDKSIGGDPFICYTIARYLGLIDYHGLRVFV